MDKYDEVKAKLAELTELLEERKKTVWYFHYIETGHYRPDSVLRHPLRKKNKPIVANCVPCPVRYDSHMKPTHVLCWVPHTSICRWIDMKTGHFLMKDLDGIPENCITDSGTYDWEKYEENREQHS